MASSEKIEKAYDCCLNLDPLSIPYPDDTVLLEYVFVNTTLVEMQHKTRVVDFEPASIEEVPEWDCSMFEDFREIDPRPEMVLKPVRLYRCPFRKGKNKIVLCDFLYNGKPTVWGTRAPFAETLEKLKDEECLFGFEQEYFVVDEKGIPLGWEWTDNFDKMFRHYLAINSGPHTGTERLFSETHTRACLYAGVKLFGVNKEDGMAQWEYQTGPSDGLKAGDDVIIARYLLERLAEMFRLHVSLAPKPVLACKLASSLHLNFSTKRMREDGGIRYIHEAIEKLIAVPQDNILKHYDRNGGKDNAKRLIGEYFVPSGTECSVGVADKFASIRINPRVHAAGKGYFEDRRPSADSDPYMVMSAFLKAALLGEEV